MTGFAAKADITRYDSLMHSPSIGLPLERPFAEFPAGPSDAKSVLLAGLRWPTECWGRAGAAMGGASAPVDADAAAELQTTSSKQFSQRVRHGARAATGLFAPL